MRALLLFLLCLQLYAQSPRPSPGPTTPTQQQQNKATPKDSKATSDDIATEGLATAVEKLASEIAAGNQEKTTAQKDKSATSNDISATDWIVTFFTGVLALLAWLQYRTLKKQADYMRDALGETKKAADAADSSAKTASGTLAAVQEQTELTRQAARAASDNAEAAKTMAHVMANAERPWLVIEMIGDYSTVPLSVSFVFCNWGRTPALVSDLRLDLRKAFTPILGTVDYESLHGMAIEHGSVIAPDKRTGIISRGLEGTGLLPEDEEAALYDGSMFIYFLGAATYADTLNPGTVRQAKFCFRWIPKGQTGKGAWGIFGPPEANRST